MASRWSNATEFGVILRSHVRVKRQFMNGRLVALFSIGIVVAWLLSGCAGTASAGTRPTVAKVGDLAPEISLKSMTGDPIVLSKLQGRPVLVNFWATWCGPCRQEFPTLVRKYKQYASQGFVVLGVDVEDTSPDSGVLTFMRNTLVNFPIVRDVDSSVESMYRINGLPTSFFIDKSGVVRDVVVGGPMTDEFIDQQFAKINQ